MQPKKKKRFFLVLILFMNVYWKVLFAFSYLDMHLHHRTDEKISCFAFISLYIAQ